MSILQTVTERVWEPLAVALPAAGLFFTAYLGAFPLRRPGLVLRSTVLRLRARSASGGLSPFQSVCTALGATVGTGNLAGVATALTLGGPGSVFWMWIAALLGMATGFAENVLGVRHRVRRPDGSFAGGPMYCLRALGLPGLAAVYAFLCLGAALGVGCLVQGSAIVSVAGDCFGLPEFPVSLVLAGAVGAVLLGGSRRIGRVTAVLVPGMVALYVGTAAVCLLLRASAVPEALGLIVRSAFSRKAAAGGVAYSGWTALRCGVQRGVFSNEAGLGSGVMAHAAAEGVTPAEQGCWSVVEIGIDTLLVCTLTALVILTSGVSGGTGAALTAAAFSAVLGRFGGAVVVGSLVLFALSTILSWGHFSGVAAEFCFGPKGPGIVRGLMVIFVALSGAVEPGTAWLAADLCNGLLAVPNLIALWLLRREVRQALRAASAAESAGRRRGAAHRRRDCGTGLRCGVRPGQGRCSGH